jgi:hypothetical protein
MCGPRWGWGLGLETGQKCITGMKHRDNRWWLHLSGYAALWRVGQSLVGQKYSEAGCDAVRPPLPLVAIVTV